MKKLFAFVVMVSCVFGMNAQNSLSISSPLEHMGSVASNSCPLDKSGNPCAKIIVEIPLEDVDFEGIYLLDNTVKHTTGQYEMFVSIPKTEGKTVTLCHKQYPSVDIPLWCDGSPLVGRQAYSIKISLPETMSAYDEYVGIKKMELPDILKSINSEYEQNNHTLTYKFLTNRGFNKLYDEDRKSYIFEDIPIYFDGKCNNKWTAVCRSNHGVSFSAESEEDFVLGEEFTPLQYSGSFIASNFETYK